MNSFLPLNSFLLVALFVLSACGRKAEREKSAPTLPTASVRVQKIEAATSSATEEVVGTVRAKVRATLEAKQSGRIAKLPINLGEQVRAGDLIAELDSAETAARLDQAEASLEQADRDWKRISTLFDQQSATRSERDTAEARLRVAKGSVAEAKAMAAYSRIVAPFDGVITKKWAEAGDLATPGKPLADLEDPRALQVELDVPEGLAASLKQGSEIVVTYNSGREETKATVRELAPAVDPITRSRRVKLDLNSEQLGPGQFVRAALPVGEQKSLFIPREALLERGQLEIVFTVADSRARMHLVKTGRTAGEDVEILSGLNSGAVVVVSGHDQLSDGQPVEVK